MHHHKKNICANLMVKKQFFPFSIPRCKPNIWINNNAMLEKQLIQWKITALVSSIKYIIFNEMNQHALNCHNFDSYDSAGNFIFF